MLIGEQPGAQEDEQGEPFVGPAGKLLDRALKEAGLERSELYVTNTVKHFKFERRGKARLHARASAKVVEAAARFQSEITIIKDGTRVNARSIMGLMMLAASLGSEIGVEADGPDADAAMTAMLALIDAKFGEE